MICEGCKIQNVIFTNRAQSRAIGENYIFAPTVSANDVQNTKFQIRLHNNMIYDPSKNIFNFHHFFELNSKKNTIFTIEDRARL